MCRRPARPPSTASPGICATASPAPEAVRILGAGGAVAPAYASETARLRGPNGCWEGAGRAATLRIRPDAAQEFPRKHANHGPMPTVSASDPAAHRVLVVDDEPNIVDVISMALRFNGF